LPRLTAVREEQENYVDPALLILDWDEARRALAKKNALAINPPKSKVQGVSHAPTN
jgi:hypothetical protein